MIADATSAETHGQREKKVEQVLQETAQVGLSTDVEILCRSGICRRIEARAAAQTIFRCALPAGSLGGRTEPQKNSATSAFAREIFP
jgi:hypothetical protein